MIDKIAIAQLGREIDGNLFKHRVTKSANRNYFSLTLDSTYKQLMKDPEENPSLFCFDLGDKNCIRVITRDYINQLLYEHKIPIVVSGAHTVAVRNALQKKFPHFLVKIGAITPGDNTARIKLPLRFTRVFRGLNRRSDF